MAQELTKKLLLHKAHLALVLNAPDTYLEKLQDELIENVILTEEPAEDMDFVLLFAQDSTELKPTLVLALQSLKTDGILWVAYPKKSSKIKSDLSRDSLQVLLRELNYEGVSLISIDETWSAMRVKPMRAN